MEELPRMEELPEAAARAGTGPRGNVRGRQKGDSMVRRLSIQQYERVFAESGGSLDGKLPVEVAVRLVVLYILSFPDWGALQSTAFYGRFSFREFIEAHASRFYFSRTVEQLLSAFTSQNGRVLESCACLEQRLSNIRAEQAVKIVPKKYSADGDTEYYRAAYVRMLCIIVPDVVVDDLIFGALRLDDDSGTSKACRADRVSLSSDRAAACGWIYQLVQHRDLRRETLRHIFDRTVYLEADDRSTIYNIVAMIIKKYKIYDCLIKADDLMKSINEARALVECPGSASNPDGGHMDGAPARPLDVVSLQSGDIQSAEKRIEALTDLGISQDRILFYRECIVNTGSASRDLSNDNVYVLVARVWDDLLFYLQSLDESTGAEQEAIAQLLTVMIECTGEFLRRRVTDNLGFIGTLEYGREPLVSSMLAGFSGTEQLEAQLITASKKNGDQSESIGRIIAEWKGKQLK